MFSWLRRSFVVWAASPESDAVGEPPAANEATPLADRVAGQQEGQGELKWWRDMTGLISQTDRQFAVIKPAASTSADDLRGLGQALVHWKTEFRQARHIWGLTDLLEGRFPRTPWVYIQGVPFASDQVDEPVALAYVTEDADQKLAWECMVQALGELSSRLCFFCDPDTYSYQNR